LQFFIPSLQVQEGATRLAFVRVRAKKMVHPRTVFGVPKGSVLRQNILNSESFAEEGADVYHTAFDESVAATVVAFSVKLYVNGSRKCLA
jgi:hypothetical protein